MAGFSPPAAEAAQKIAAGPAVAWVDDSTNLRPGGNLTVVSAVPPLATQPYAIATSKGATQLAERWV